VIEVKNLTKQFTSAHVILTAVNDVSFSIGDNQFASIVGTSGSGKSTLLSLLGGLDKPSEGSVRVDDQIISSGSDRDLISYRRHKVGFVFQAFNLIPNLTARENVMLPMEFAGVATSGRGARAEELLDQVGLTGATQGRRPSRLSGGEQQRVAIARALANRPRVILADEPTGNLDSKTGRLIFELLKDLSRSADTTVIIVTHDAANAQKTDVTLRLEDGRLVAPR
jgi:putative ABC transport system ATP-binding protein